MKKILALLLLVAMCTALVSCGGAGEEPKNNDAPANEETQAKEQEATEEKEYTAMDFIGMKFSEVEKIYGTEYSKNTYQGAYYLMYDSEDIPYAFMVLFMPEETPVQEKEVVSVDIGTGGIINKDYRIGMSKAEMEKVLGSEIEVGDIEGFGNNVSAIEIDDCTIDLYFDEDMNLSGATVRKQLQ